jgi:hypothetical protein
MSYPTACENPSPNFGEMDTTEEKLSAARETVAEQAHTIRCLTKKISVYAIRARRLKEKLLELGAADLVEEVAAAERADAEFEKAQIARASGLVSVMRAIAGEQR